LQDAYDYSDQKDADNKAEIEATARLLAQIEDNALKNSMEDYIDSEIQKAKLSGGSGGGSSTPVTKNFTQSTGWPYDTRQNSGAGSRISYTKNINTGMNLNSVTLTSIGWGSDYYASKSWARSSVSCTATINSSNRQLATITCNSYSRDYRSGSNDNYRYTNHYNLVNSVTIRASGTQ